MNPPYQTIPPREKSAAGSWTSAAYQTLAPTTPPISAAKMMSDANSRFSAAPLELEGDQPAAHEEGHHQHEAVAGDLERAQVDVERIDGHGWLRVRRRE